MTGSESEDTILEELRRTVDEFGCQMISIAGDGDEPDWAFSIGLFATHGHPEVAVFGLEPELSQEVFDQLVDRIEDGAKFVADTTSEGIVEGFHCMFRTVPQRHYEPYLKLACEFYGDQDFPVLQLFWPDKQGRFPWDAGVRPGYRDLQPVLEEL